ncbi:MAG: extracellular solute-binding protein [bacterium]|nr:extracellular solute-binding protein [bacterium]
MTRAVISVWLTHEHEQLVRNTIVPDFKKKYPSIDVAVTTTGWRFLWEKVAMFSKKKQGPDVLQFGSTWNGALSQLGALRDITSQVNKMGGLNSFVPASARLCTFPGSNKISSVPWYVDVRALYFRKDVLDEHLVASRDLETLDDLIRICEKVHNTRIDNKEVAAFGVFGSKDSQIVHNIAPWIWNYGGHFLRADGKEAAFHEPAALKGLEIYFNLINIYSKPDLLGQNYDAFVDAYAVKGEYTFAYLGPWLNNTHLNPKSPTYNKISASIHPLVMPSGTAGRFTFMGGSNLAISSFAHHPDEAWSFIEFLMQRKVQEQFCAANNQLPSLLDCYTPTFLMDTTRNKVFKESVRYGRGFPNSPCWAPIEDILIDYVYDIFIAIRSKSYSKQVLKEKTEEAAMKCNAILKNHNI